MIWSSFIAVFRKDVLHILRQRSTLLTAMSYPIFQLVLFGFIDLSVRNLPTVIVDQDQSQYSRELVDRLRATGTFDIVRVGVDPTLARDDIVAGRAKVGVVIPPDFRDRCARHEPTSVQALVDGSDGTVSTQAVAVLNGVAAEVSLEALAKGAPAPGRGMPLSVQSVVLFNPKGRSAAFLIPGMVAMQIQIIGIMLTAMSMVREREQGTLEQLLVSPIHPVGLMLGKLAPYLVLGMIQAIIILCIMCFGFSVPIRGSLFFLGCSMVLYLLGLQALGLFIAARSASQGAAIHQTEILILPSFFLSGYIFPAEALPRPLYALGRLLPATHMLEIMRGVVLRDAGLLDLLPNVSALIGFSILFFWLSVKFFKKVAD